MRFEEHINYVASQHNILYFIATLFGKKQSSQLQWKQRKTIKCIIASQRILGQPASQHDGLTS